MVVIGRAIWIMVCGVFIAAPAGVARGGDGALPPPRNIAVADIGGGRALISWEAGSRDEDGFRVERQPARLDGDLKAGRGGTAVVDVCGDGEFSYRVQALRGMDESSFSPWVSVVVTSAAQSRRAADWNGRSDEIVRGVRISEDGWVELRPSADTQIIYVSSTDGSDRNDGLSESAPKRTIAAGYRLLRDGRPDWLLLKSGDVWEEGELWWNKSGRSPEERMAVGVYGGSARAVWKTGRESGIHGNSHRGGYNANLVFMDLHLVQHENDGTIGGSGFMLMNGWQDVLIENCKVSGYRVNMIFQAYSEGVRQRNIAVRRSVIVDALATNEAHAQGIFADGVDGLLLEENVLDRNGWGPDAPTANMFRHNTYIQTGLPEARGCTNVVSRGNISARASATGLMQRPGGIVEGNLLLANPIGVVFGQNGGPMVSGRLRGNVVLDARDIAPGQPRGIGLWLTNTHDVEVARNIVAHQRGGTGNIVGINADGMHADLTIRDNIIYDWAHTGSGRVRGEALAWHGMPHGPLRIEENEFQQVGGGHVVVHHTPLSEAFTYSGNRYYSANQGSDEFARRMTHAQWVARAGERGSEFAPRIYPDADRTIARYMKSLDEPGTAEEKGIEAFLSEARRQEKGHWREEFTARAVIEYVRKGFGVETW